MDTDAIMLTGQEEEANTAPAAESDYESVAAPPASKRRKTTMVVESPKQIVRREKFDKKTAQWLLKNLTPALLGKSWDGTKQGHKWEGTPQQYVDSLKTSLAKWIKSGGKVTYTKSKKTAKLGMGRWYADGGYQTMPRSIRGLLAAQYYLDIDIANAQPVILEQLAKRKGWECIALTKFNANRNGYLGELMEALGSTRDVAKGHIIALFFGQGAIKTAAAKLPAFFTNELQPLLSKLRGKIWDDPEYAPLKAELAKHGDTSPLSLLAHVLQNEECKCEEAKVRELERQGWMEAVFIHDGGLDCPEDSSRKLEAPPELLRKLEEAIKRDTGYSMTLACKPLTTHIVIPAVEMGGEAEAAEEVPLAEEWVSYAAQVLVALPQLELHAETVAFKGVVMTDATTGVREARIDLAATACPASSATHAAPCVSAHIKTGGWATLKCTDEACKRESLPFQVSAELEVGLLGATPPRHYVTVPPSIILDVDDKFAAEQLARRMVGMLIKDKGTLHVFDDARGLWSHSESVLLDVATRQGTWLKFTADGKKVHNYSGSVHDTANLLVKLPSVLPNNDNYFLQDGRVASEEKKLLFCNGIYDFETAEFTAGFDPAIVFKAAMPRDFPAERNEANITWLDAQLFKEPFEVAADGKCENGALLRHSVMRAVIGDSKRKKAVLGLGPRNSGKTLLQTCVTAALGSPISSPFDANNLLAKSFVGEAAKDNAWLIPLESARLAFSQEVKNTAASKRSTAPVIDSNAIKPVIGQDVIVARLMRENQYAFKTKVSLFIMMNDIPTIPGDPTLVKKLDVVTYAYSYVDDPKEAYERKADPDLEAKYTTRAMSEAFFWIMVDEFQRWKASGYAELVKSEAQKEVAAELMPVVSALDALQSEYTITKDDAHRVPSEELIAHMKSRGVCGSDMLLARELGQLVGKAKPARAHPTLGKRWDGTVQCRFGIVRTSELEALQQWQAQDVSAKAAAEAERAMVALGLGDPNM